MSFFMKTLTKLSAFLISFLMLLAAFSPALAFPSLTAAPRMHEASVNGSSWSSYNWSGYTVTGPAGSVTSASGSWIVPAVTGTTTAYAACWTGIDGFSSSTVEQTGTLSYISNGYPLYYAWYEFYPLEAIIPISAVPVNPGDKISASVTYSTSPSEFTLTIEDITASKSFSITATVASLGYTPARSSAEWIVEAPSSSSGILPLAYFGTAYLGNAYTGVSETCFATISGVSGDIASFGTAVQTITMVNTRGAAEATPSSLSSGTSFSITEPSVTPPPPPPHHHR
jgi:hypothetical protein